MSYTYLVKNLTYKKAYWKESRPLYTLRIWLHSCHYSRCESCHAFSLGNATHSLTPPDGPMTSGIGRASKCLKGKTMHKSTATKLPCRPPPSKQQRTRGLGWNWQGPIQLLSRFTAIDCRGIQVVPTFHSYYTTACCRLSKILSTT